MSKAKMTMANEQDENKMMKTENDTDNGKADSQRSVVQVPIEKLVPHSNHPFKVQDDEAMRDLVENIRQHGVVAPIIVRQIGTDRYEIISGHRRVYASKQLGLKTVPVIVMDLDDVQADLLMVHTNLQQREYLLPSERAKAYKVIMDHNAHRGQRSDLTTSCHDGRKLTAVQTADEYKTSERMVHRFMRLNYLISDILELVDNDKIKLLPAVELSYLSESEQKELVAAVCQTNKYPSYSKAKQIRELGGSVEATCEKFAAILFDNKRPQIAPVTFDYSELSLYFPQEMSSAEIKKIMIGLLADYSNKIQKKE